MMGEVWKPILGYKGYYEVSNFGNVRSIDRVVKGRHGDTFLRGKTLKQVIGRGGYLSVSLSKNGSHKSLHVHFLVSLAFIGKRKPGLVVNHKDGDMFNNVFSNLEYVNKRENYTHKSVKTRSKMIGAFLNKRTGRWISRVYAHGKQVTIGTYQTSIEAHNAYINFLQTNGMENKYAI